ncbi:MAG TPA: nucleoside monophosphate kinase [Candidatus Paceibacterota bacterium]|nr:nucleoside monophosphate kinase [Candidatus Paceibacterota bacterium]
MKHPITVVFFGKSGAGKGTQATLLLKSFERLDAARPTIYVETGQKFRNFVSTSPSYMAKRIYEVIHAGKFLPPFIPIWMWTQFFVDEIKTGEEHMVFDGVCRQPEEGPILDSALQFLGRIKPVVILLDVHHDEVTKRLLKRGRHDDTHEKIASRLAAFEKEGMPSVTYFKTSPHVKFVTVNGDQPIEKVHEDVLAAIGIEGRL